VETRWRRSEAGNVGIKINDDMRLPGHGISEDDQWKIQAPHHVGSQGRPLRYGEIRSGLLRGAEGTQEIAPRVLSRELKALTHTGLIGRKDYGVVPPKVEYRLTRKGQSFIPVISAIRQWGARHLRQAGHGEKIDQIAAE
jgi:DNA-binding HxlR family transcriptional regulator